MSECFLGKYKCMQACINIFNQVKHHAFFHIGSCYGRSLWDSCKGDQDSLKRWCLRTLHEPYHVHILLYSVCKRYAAESFLLYVWLVNFVKLIYFWNNGNFFQGTKGATQVHKLYDRKHATVGLRNMMAKVLLIKRKKAVKVIFINTINTVLLFQ